MAPKTKSESSLTFLKNAFWQEVAETKQLARLLKKKSQGRPLDASETEKLNEQLLDLSKMVPLISILLLPGGTLVILLLEKFLPFSLLPSSFKSSQKTTP